MTARSLLLQPMRKDRPVGPRLLVWADDRDAEWMRDHLVTSIEREGWSPSMIGEFVMEIRPADNPNELLATFAATERNR